MKAHRFTSVCLVLLLSLLAGCAMVNDRAWRLFSSSSDALAIVNGQLLRGTVKLVPDRTGTVSLSGDKGSIQSCFGALHFTATQAGSIDLRCNDGSDVALRFVLLSDSRGYAYGQTTQGPASLSFGLSNDQAISYLKLSEPHKLVEVGKDKTLELQ